MSYFEDEELDEIAEGEVKVKTDGMTATVSLGNSALESIAAGIAQRLENALARKLERAVSEKLDAMVDDAVTKVIGDRAEALVREAIEKPRQKTNEWGSPTGPIVTLAELIPGIVDNYLNAKVNDKGQVDSYSRDSKVTRAGFIIATMVREHIDPVTTQAVSNITKQARDIVAQKIATFVSEQMVPAIEARKS